MRVSPWLWFSATSFITTKVWEEAEALSSEIIQDIELGRERLSKVILKAIRLTQILNDLDVRQEFAQASSGHMGKSIEQLEYDVAKGEALLQGTYQGTSPGSSPFEKKWILRDLDLANEALASRRTRIHSYVTGRYYEMRFSGLANDVFERIRSRVDSTIGVTVPGAVEKLVSAYNNLASANPEDWSNAAHSCRRVLQALADAVFPPQDGTRTRNVNGKQIKVRLGASQYINRLIAYIEDSSESEIFTEIVGSHLRYIGDRLDSVFNAVQKGSHNTLSKEDADRCVVYTYLLVGDILLLGSPPSPQ